MTALKPYTLREMDDYQGADQLDPERIYATVEALEKEKENHQRFVVEHSFSAFDALKAERDEARALKVPATTEDVLQANMAKATAECERDTARAEVAALGEALRRIVGHLTEPRGSLALALSIARAALAGKEKP